MLVIGTEILDRAIRKHRDLARPIASWLTIASNSRWENLAELRRTWRDTDVVTGETIFNIKGNKYRLFTLINYDAQTIVVQKLITHAEYSKRQRS